MCNIFIKPKSKYKHFKSNTNKKIDKCKHIGLTIEEPDINDIDNAIYAYFIQNKKKYAYYLIKFQFKKVFNDNQCCPYVTSKLFDNKTMISWQNFQKKK